MMEAYSNYNQMTEAYFNEKSFSVGVYCNILVISMANWSN